MSTTFSEIPEGSAVYLDANVFIYDFAEKSRNCSDLLDRCRSEVLHGVVSTLTLAEVAHVAMCVEAADLLQMPEVRAPYLKRHRELVRTLNRYAEHLADLTERSNLCVIEVTEKDLLSSRRIRDQYGLLTNDSIIAHLVLDWEIPAMATNDADFEGIEGIEVFKPGDVG